MSGAVTLSSGLGGIGSSVPLSSGASSSRIPVTMSADDGFLLVPPPPPGPSASHQHHGHAAPSTTRNGIPTMAEVLYGSNSFDFPVLYPTTAGTGTAGGVGSTSSDGGNVDSDHAAAASCECGTKENEREAGPRRAGIYAPSSSVKPEHLLI
jgi:hypothetical protein